MEIFITLLSEFLEGQLSPEEFASKFIKARNDLVNEQYAIIDSDEAATLLLDQLSNQLKQKRITNAEYADRMTNIIKPLEGFRIHPFSKAAEIIDHMMGEADAFEGDPPPTSGNISSEQLRIEAAKSLHELQGIQNENNNHEGNSQ